MMPPEFNPADEYDDEEQDGHGEQDARPAVFVTTREPIAIAVTKLDDPRAPDSSALAAYIDGRLVARSAMPAEAIDRLLELKLFEGPIPLGLFAYEEDPGMQCRLFALVPRSALDGESHEAEPWKESVPSFEASLASAAADDDEAEAEASGPSGNGNGEDDEDGEDETEELGSYETILLGHIVRFAKDRRHPDDLAAEAVDILQRIIHGAESLEDADRKAIDDLLGSL